MVPRSGPTPCSPQKEPLTVAKDSIHFAVTPQVREHLIAVATYGMRDGADFTRHGKASRSALLRYTIERAALSCVAPPVVALALPEKATTTDGEALECARKAAGLSHRELAAVLGHKSHASVLRMEQGKQGLSPAAREWLAERNEEKGDAE